MIPLEEQLPDRPMVRLRLGTVTAKFSGYCTITLGGVSIPEVPYLVAPAQGNVVHVLQDGEVLLILGPSQVP